MNAGVGRVESAGLWAAVHSITEPTRRRIQRDELGDWLWEVRNSPDATLCDVAAYRAATTRSGTIPALWDQAVWALTTGTERASEGGASPLRERSPADLDLMETMLTIRETLVTQLAGREQKPRDTPKAQMLQLASYLIAHGPSEHVEWWTFRFTQWARVLTNQLNAADHAPKPVRLRNSACPACTARTITEQRDDGTRIVVPALTIDFTADGAVRAATCAACAAVWWRGADMEQLANKLGCKIA